MEGPLSKWTNVMQGWQYRWFVLDESAGILSYYTGAVVGVDDEDDSTFTITVDQKMFHFQGRDSDERDRWIRALELTIQKHTGYFRPRGNKWIAGPSRIQPTLMDFERRIQEADKYLQLMIEQVKSLESRVENCTNPRDKETLTQVIESSNAMLESVKHSIVVLQLAKNYVLPVDGIPVARRNHQNRPNNVAKNKSLTTAIGVPVGGTVYKNNSFSESSTRLSEESGIIEVSSSSMHEATVANVNLPLSLPPVVLLPTRSYSSSEDEEEEYFDAEEQYPSLDLMEDLDSLVVIEEENVSTDENGGDGFTVVDGIQGCEEPEPDYSDEGTDFDRVYDCDQEDELGNVQEHGSIIMHLLSQVSIGMDLTKITLPTFILERRSLLEMYADFFASPDLFVSIADLKTPEDRMIGMLKWYLSTFYAGRKSGVAKKPYNPLLGETFRCVLDVPGCSKSEVDSDNSLDRAWREMLDKL